MDVALGCQNIRISYARTSCGNESSQIRSDESLSARFERKSLRTSVPNEEPKTPRISRQGIPSRYVQNEEVALLRWFCPSIGHLTTTKEAALPGTVPRSQLQKKAIPKKVALSRGGASDN